MKKQLKALMVAGNSKFGGGSLVVYNLMNPLRDHGIDVTLLATDPAIRKGHTKHEQT